jgi:arylsulfatase A-like enzyme
MTRPNIVVVMTDQQRADVSAREGWPLDTTPFLDGLARGGTWFNRAYTASPLCTPARVSLLTGRYPGAHRIRENFGVDRAVYERDLFDVAREHGYRTALIGKNHSHVTPERVDRYFNLMHNGANAGAGLSETERAPDEAAFDEWLRQLNHRVAMEPAPFPLECQLPYRIVSDAVRWIDSSSREAGETRDAPFCLWLSFPEPHNPYQVPEPYYSLFPPESIPPLVTGKDALEGRGFKWEYARRIGDMAHPTYDELIPRARANYMGMLRLIDDQMKRLVGFLDERGLRENTLLVFVSDHGDFVGEYGLMRKGPEVPEILTRVPMFWHGPGIAPRGDAHPAHVSLVDVFPTLCEAADLPQPAGVQGRSLWPLLTGSAYPEEEFASAYVEQGIGGLHYTDEDVTALDQKPGFNAERSAFDELNAVSQSGLLRMVRRGDWKLALDMHGRGQLYHLPSDPLELRNRFGDPDCAAVQGELLVDLAAWMMRAQDPLPVPERGYRRKTDPRNYWAPYRTQS